MRGKPNRYKNKILVALVALFTMLMCTSVGFAAWITTGGGSASINGNIEADTVITGSGENVDCITISSVTGPAYYDGTEASGFVTIDGTYDKKNGYIAFAASINLTSARTVITTLNSNGTFNFNIALATNVAISGLTASVSELTVKSNYTSVNPFVGSPVSNSLGANELFNVRYPIGNLSSTNHTTLSIDCKIAFTFSSDVFSTELANFSNGTHKFVLTLGAN